MVRLGFSIPKVRGFSVPADFVPLYGKVNYKAEHYSILS